MIVDEISGIPSAFSEFLEARGLTYDHRTQLDLLASALGSQFILFAGPSGTGKSTAARVLSDFFVPSGRRAILDARPAWTSSEDLVGHYSPFNESFALGPGALALVRLHREHDAKGVPVIIVEEANLSPMEAYLGPVVTATSAIAFDDMYWRLHQQDEVQVIVPPALRFAPWPRIMGTINVDSTAQAPAPKISGRANVVLLEPPSALASLESTDALTAPDLEPAVPPGASVFGDPRAAWSSYVTCGEEQRFTRALVPLLEVLQDSAGMGSNLVSPRDVQRAVLYMAWHVPLAEASGAGGSTSGGWYTEAAENSILHFVLPGLSSEQFRRAADPLAAASTEGGLLAARLHRLSSGGEGLFGVPPDYWASLS